MLSSKLTVGVHILTLLALTRPGPDLGVHRRERQHERRGHPPPARPAPRGRGRRVPGGDRRRMAAQGPRRANHAPGCAPGGRAAGRDDCLAPERAQPALPGGSEHPGHPYSGLWRGRAADGRSARQDDHRGHPGLGPKTGTGLSLFGESSLNTTEPSGVMARSPRGPVSTPLIRPSGPFSPVGRRGQCRPPPSESAVAGSQSGRPRPTPLISSPPLHRGEGRGEGVRAVASSEDSFFALSCNKRCYESARSRRRRR